ncbi:MAG: hypothetical protein GXP42_12765 [Chloroflexi bacterium]|nr:hypothetical protein [Chloroflexota bacterium]
MTSFLKFIGGAALGAAIGAGVYFVLTSEREEGLVHDFKALVNEVIEGGKRAAEQRRIELEMELRGESPTAQPASTVTKPQAPADFA